MGEKGPVVKSEIGLCKKSFKINALKIIETILHNLTHPS